MDLELKFNESKQKNSISLQQLNNKLRKYQQIKQEWSNKDE